MNEWKKVMQIHKDESRKLLQMVLAPWFTNEALDGLAKSLLAGFNLDHEELSLLCYLVVRGNLTCLISNSNAKTKNPF